MNFTLLTTIAATGFTVAFFHAAIPTHWLPFVLVSRARGWTRGRTMAVALFAGLGHVALTTLLGLLIAWLGFQLDEEIGHAFAPIAGGVLVAIGGYYIWRQFWGGGICHHAIPGSHHHADEHCGEEPEGGSHWEKELKDSRLASVSAGDWTAISGLFLMLTLSPCEGFLPVYLSAVQFGWTGFVVLSVILAIATLAGMTVFTWLTLVGFEKLKLGYIEKWEAGLLGVIFILLGLTMLMVQPGAMHS
jgi:nickel/cobalt transporter (NicO) family protein